MVNASSILKKEFMSGKSKLTKATYGEYQASLWGGILIAFGLGVLFGAYFQPFTFVIILIGIISHSWGMYKIHERNK